MLSFTEATYYNFELILISALITQIRVLINLFMLILDLLALHLTPAMIQYSILMF